MNQRLAVEALVAALLAGQRQARVIVQVQVHAIQRRQSVGAGGHDGQRTRQQRFLAARRVARMQILDQVRRAHDQGRQPGMAGDGVQTQKAQRRFAHGPQGKVGGRAGRVQCPRQRVQLGRAFDLGQQHGVGAGGGEGARVVQSPRRVQRVDARHAFASAVAAGLQGGRHLRARLWLGVGRDRVLQVQDQHVGIQASGLVERAGVGAGHVERGAAGAGRGGMHRGVAGVADSGLGLDAAHDLHGRGADVADAVDRAYAHVAAGQRAQLRRSRCMWASRRWVS